MAGYRAASPLLVLALLLGAFTLCPVDASGARRELKQTTSVNATSSSATDGDCAMPSTTYLYATSKTVRRGIFSPDFPAVAHVQSGDIITAECVTHQATQDYAKMVRGDPGVEDIFNWPNGVAPINKSVPTIPGNGAHIITGPIRVCGAEPGDILQVDILTLEPRKNPSTGRTFAANTQSNPLSVFNVPNRAGGTNPSTAIVYEVTKDEFGAWATPVYQFLSPNTTGPDGRPNGAGAMIPHATNIGISSEPVTYPDGFQSQLSGANGITYTNASLAFRVPLRPHLGTIGVTPANASKFINGAPNGTIGASSQAPTKSGGNVDQWRTGPGSTMYYQVQIPGANLVFGDCHAAEGDSELSGNAVEASLTGTFRLSLIKAADAPLPFQNLGFPLLETDSEIIIHGFAYPDYLNQLDVPSQIGQLQYGPDLNKAVRKLISGSLNFFTNFFCFAADYLNQLDIPSQIGQPQFGPDLNKAVRDAYVKTRNFIMDGFGVTESEAISIMSVGVDFGVTQIVDANWGIHAIMKKSLFSRKSASTFGRRLMGDDTTGKSVVQLMADWKAARESQAELSKTDILPLSPLPSQIELSLLSKSLQVSPSPDSVLLPQTKTPSYWGSSREFFSDRRF
ncbi:hypothetical protein KFL_000450065 [Klebsormidium nitens]|uniref:Acetamidase/formamidase n=1 Tax=Klebsormidium nitens TaxID=105231 RepID=A0A1Y1HN39_KLENI|nr:hypothetical protein KFL_000450065 [Klebsormidium nitens]|eukprot:GAQ80050.1 hypothetical protein KFL_000450065 [Klebsormidium nitens]